MYTDRMAQETDTGIGSLLRSLASLRLAVVILVVLAVVLAMATVFESRWGPDAAQRFIYHALWFNLLMVLLAVNVAAAALVRLPWRFKQTGFLVTHLAILLILGGCLTTSRWGVTGTMTLSEGQQEQSFVQDGLAVQATYPGSDNSTATLQIPLSDPLRAGTAIDLPVAGESQTLRVLHVLPNAEQQMELVVGQEGDPVGVLIEMVEPGMSKQKGASAGRRMQQWLLLGNQDTWAIDTPSFSLVAAAAYAPSPAPAASSPGKGTLVATIDGQEYRADVEAAMAGHVLLADTKTTLRVTNHYEHAAVGAGGRISEDPTRPVNPAVTVEVNRDGQTEVRIIFAKFGDISAMHGAGKSQAVKLAYEHALSSEDKLRVVLVPRKEGWVLYEEKGAALLQQVALTQDSPVPLKTVPVSLAVHKTLAHAREGTKMVAAPLGKDMAPQPAMEVQLGNTQSSSQWLAWSEPVTFDIDGHAVQLTLGPRRRTLPFAVRLESFEVETYGGSNMPAMYRSEVTVFDPRSSHTERVTIEMNRPLKYDGWSFFQSSYTIRGAKKVSVLSVSKDPGEPLVYIGAILLILGTAIITVQRLRAQGARGATTTVVEPAPDPEPPVAAEDPVVAEDAVITEDNDE